MTLALTPPVAKIARPDSAAARRGDNRGSDPGASRRIASTSGKTIHGSIALPVSATELEPIFPSTNGDVE